jgi:hypothetical protein
MKVPLANSEQFALIDDEDKNIVLQYRWYLNTDGYVRTTTLPRLSLHQLVVGASPTGAWDHANGNKLDCRSENLRAATVSENGANRKRGRNNSSGYKGIDSQAGLWRVRIAVNGKRIYLGHFTNLERAAEAYESAARKHFGKFARAN